MNSFKDLAPFAINILNNFSVELVDEDRCRRLVLNIFHPEGPVCCYCGSKIDRDGFVDRFYKMYSVQCPHCSKWLKATTGTFLQGSHLTFRQVVVMLLLFELNVGIGSVAQFLGVDHETVRRWRLRLKAERNNLVKTSALDLGATKI